jgi:hypothetical protein
MVGSRVFFIRLCITLVLCALSAASYSDCDKSEFGRLGLAYDIELIEDRIYEISLDFDSVSASGNLLFSYIKYTVEDKEIMKFPVYIPDYSVDGKFYYEMLVDQEYLSSISIELFHASRQDEKQKYSILSFSKDGLLTLEK